MSKIKSDRINLKVTYSTDDKGFLDKKSIKTRNLDYTIQYHYDNGKVSGFLINGLNKMHSNELFLDFNLQHQLSRILHKKKENTMPFKVVTEEMLFDYQSNGNINSIRIIDKNGRISKEINFEYDYFSL